MAKETISILDGSTFLVSGPNGDVDASPDQPHGFFYRDTRFISHWRLTANGAPLKVLSTDDVNYFSAQFFLVPPIGTVNDSPTVSIIRNRMIGDGFHEDVTVLNHDLEPLEVELRLEAGADSPTEYPTASSPQAWATGTPLLLIRTLLGLEPKGGELESNSVLPEVIGELGLSSIPGRWGKIDVTEKEARA